MQADHGGEKKHEGDHGDDYGDSHEDVVGAIDGGAGLSQENEENAEETLGEDGKPGSFPAGMELTEGAREIAIKAGNERKASGGGEVGSCSADVAESDEKSGEFGDPGKMKARRGLGDGLRESIEVG